MMAIAQTFALALYAAALPISLSVMNIALGLIVFSALFKRIAQRGKIEIPASFFFLFLFFCWALITQSCARGSFKISDLNAYDKLWNFFPFLFIPALTELRETKIQWAVKIALGIAGLVAVLGAVQYWSGLHYFFEGWFNTGALVYDKRFYGFQSYPLHTAGIYTILLALALNLFLKPGQSKKEKIFYGASFVLTCMAVLITGSRSYYLGMLAAIGLSASFRGWKILITFLTIALLGIYIMARWEPYVAERILSIQPEQTDESGRQRLYAWKSAIQMILDHPIRGVGYKNWKETIPQYAGRFPDWKMDPALKGHAHNSFLNIAAETGLPGFALIISFWILFLKEEVRRCKGRSSGTLPYSLSVATMAGTFAVMVASLFEHNTFTAMVILPLFFVAGLSKRFEGSTPPLAPVTKGGVNPSPPKGGRG